MPNTTKSNKLKRKRGKKFVWHGNKEDSDKPQQTSSTDNPFESHEKVVRMRKDIDKREELLNEFRRLNKNSVIKDNRIGESSSKLSEEDKMKLRYMREQRDRAREMLVEKDKEMEDRKDAKSGN